MHHAEDIFPKDLLGYFFLRAKLRHSSYRQPTLAYTLHLAIIFYHRHVSIHDTLLPKNVGGVYE